MIATSINDFARWLDTYDVDTLRLWVLGYLAAFWGAVGWVSYQALGSLGVMFQ